MIRKNHFQNVLPNIYDIPVQIFANSSVKIEQNALDELSTLLDLQKTISEIQAADPDFFASEKPEIVQVAVTPDFHKGAGIPIGTTLLTKGFAVPQAIGKDINCGMRMYVTDLSATQIEGNLKALSQKIRHAYFQGGRQIILTQTQKQALLQYGLVGLLETAKATKNEGLWKYYQPEQQAKDLEKVIDKGSLATKGVFSGLENYVKGGGERGYDSQMGSIGGGNHFVEVQTVEQVFEGATAYQWGLKKEAVVVMIHTGSVSIGYPTALYIMDLLKQIYPKNLKYPANGIFPLPISEKYASVWDTFEMALHNAANFAFCNRMFLGLILEKIMHEHFGSCKFELLYDSGHNLMWETQHNEKTTFLHRKGACPARGANELQATPFAWTGEPVLIPGSMGATSFILAGKGNEHSNFSASHGAGRSLSRGESLKYEDKLFQAFLKKFHIITPIDPERADIKSRSDILQKWHDELKKEAPFAFKPLHPVIDTQVEAGIVSKVAETRPIFTVKG